MALARRVGFAGLVGLVVTVLALAGGCAGSGEGADDAGAGGGGAGGARDDGCAPLPLEEGCTAGCPSSPDDVQLFCTGDFRTTTRGITECGGSYVKVNYGLGYSTYYFDQNDVLVGKVSATDAGGGCTEGNGPITTTFGETCRATGEAVDLCAGSAGGGGAGGNGAGGDSAAGDGGAVGAGGSKAAP